MRQFGSARYASAAAIVLLSAFMPAAGYAGDKSLCERSRFDIDGICLYMPADDVMAALHARYPKLKPTIHHIPSEAFHGKQRTDTIELSADNFSIHVGFQSGFPGDKSREQADDISITYKGDPDDGQNFSQNFYDSVLKKYGPPSVVGPTIDYQKQPDFWCTSPNSIQGSDPRSPQSCNTMEPYLKFYRNELELTDGSVAIAVARSLAKPPKKAPEKPVPNL